MRTLLILTAGQTDVQLIEGDTRKEFRKEMCAALHAELEGRKDWSLSCAPDVKCPGEVEELPLGSFALCTPKLDAVLDDLEERKLQATHTLIIDTRRAPEAAPGDPRAAGLVLERRLQARLGERATVWRATILQGRERLEDRKEPRDAVIRRDVVARLDQAVREAVRQVSGGRIVVATTGGMPTVATLVEDIVRLHTDSGTTIELVEVADGAKTDPPTRDRIARRRSIPEPAESYRARRHALELIVGGNPLGAWGAVRHLCRDEVESRWTRVVEWLSRFAASLPLPSECDIKELRHPLMTMQAALRVEFALWAADIPRAVHGTVGFFEAALQDHLNTHVTQHPQKRELFSVRPSPNPRLINSTTKRDRKRPFEVAEQSQGVTWYRILHYDAVGASTLVQSYLGSAPLKKLQDAIGPIRELRNDVAHNVPTPKLMEDAQRRMAQAGLWSNDGRFLTQPLVLDTLSELGEGKPDVVCENLIATVRARLLAG